MSRSTAGGVARPAWGSIATGAFLSLTLAACGTASSSAVPSAASIDQVHILAQWKTGGDAGRVAVGFGSVWIPNPGAGTISRVDIGSKRVIATITIGDHQLMLSRCGVLTVHDVPHGSFLIRRCEMPSAIAVADGSLWALRNVDDSVVRIDPSTNRVIAMIPTGITEFELAAGPAGVWTTDLSGTVVHIDPRHNQVVGSLHLSGIPSGVMAADQSVWVARTLDNAVSHIDAGTTTAVASVHVDLRPLALATGFGSVWVRNEWNEGASTVSRIDPATNRVIASIPVGANAGRDGLDGIAVGNGLVWVSGMYLEAIDPQTNHIVVHRFHQTNALVFAQGAIWSTDLEGTVSRIEPPTPVAGLTYPW